ncbi:MAG: V-type ATP synthase subunit F [Candidatus Schekmanbacteria bacterium]|nr:V-type ATP synthase subunit F [Candidatus Schekmanbacteria bacterium]
MQKECKILIITGPQLAVGYRLAGVDVSEAGNSDEAERIIDAIVKSGREYGIVGIDDDIYNAFSEKTVKKIDEMGVPLVVPLPSGNLNRWGRKKQGENYAAKLIQNAIGYQIKVGGK